MTYNVTVSDTHGGSSIKPVVFTVTGTNDAPALAAGPNLSGAVSFYGAEGNSADTVGANNGTDHNTTYVAGHDGQAFNFTGSNYTTIGNIIPSDFTMSGWMKTTASSPTGTQFFNGNGLVYADVGGLSHDFGVSILNNHLAFGTGGNFDSTIQSTTVVNTGDWINWAVTRSGSVISLYINGVLEASEDTTYAGPLNAPTVITLGANNRRWPLLRRPAGRPVALQPRAFGAGDPAALGAGQRLPGRSRGPGQRLGLPDPDRRRPDRHPHRGPGGAGAGLERRRGPDRPGGPAVGVRRRHRRQPSARAWARSPCR